MVDTHQDRETAPAGRTTPPDRSASAATLHETGVQDHPPEQPPAIMTVPITPPPDPDPGQRDEGCRFIAADVEWRRWRYCGKPIRRGLEDRQRCGEEIIRQLSAGEPLDRA